MWMWCCRNGVACIPAIECCLHAAGGKCLHFEPALPAMPVGKISWLPMKMPALLSLYLPATGKIPACTVACIAFACIAYFGHLPAAGEKMKIRCRE